MPSHTRGPRKRSRKSRGAGSRATPPSTSSELLAQASPGREGTRAGTQSSRASAHARPARTVGERPQAPWHPLPLAELLILAGAIATAIGFARNFAGAKLLLAGIAAVALGTIEVTLREHRAGFRSHTLLLSVLPVVVMHSAIVLIVSAFTSAPAALSVGLLVLDVAVFAVLFKLLRSNFLDARARAAARR